ncbi:MAG: Stp1/IreP family PP2C-type Ser/Thr phosphatase [Sandaracinaceae bacterium]
MRILAHGATDVGRVRQLNEDHFLVDDELDLYVVCDGMGGHAAGDVASKTTAATVHQYVTERRAVLDAVVRGDSAPDEIASILSHAIQSASAAVHDMGVQDPKRRGMGTTCVALVVVGGKGVLGHVGDSRLYLSRSGQVYQLTEDHTFVQEALKRGMITPEQAVDNPHANIVTRAVGPQASVLVDTLVFDILPGDTLLLCSDGLHNYVNDAAELQAAMGEVALETMTNGLINKANERGGADNITTLSLRATVQEQDKKKQTIRALRVNAELDALHHIILFSELDMKQLVKVGNKFEHRDYPADQVVVTEGDVAETLFVIIKGAARVTRNGADIAMLRAGDHFGEMALLSRRPRSATVRTLKDSQLLALDRESFYELMSTDPVIAAKFLWRLAQGLSLRLDDIYLLQDRQEADGRPGRETRNYGIFPSPFDGR